jgi:2,4-dienoyl-CoA reductase (NADPH2)
VATASRLFQPILVNGVHIPNRVIMGSMHTGLEEESDFEELAAFYSERAFGEVGMIITGGFSPNLFGRLSPFAAQFSSRRHLRKHREVTDAIHQTPTKVLLQILHAGRYAHHPLQVAPSAIGAPITRFRPWKMPLWLIKKTIKDFAESAVLAEQAGYDGIEIMGSEGYLINQFLAAKTNHRKDGYGGDFLARARFALEIVEEIKKRVSHSGFLVMFRMSLLDLVQGGSTFEETIQLGGLLKSAGVDIINSGIGWHEARIPTIATQVPHGTFVQVTAKVSERVKLPFVAVNRMNRVEHLEAALSHPGIEFVSMARPLLADPEFVRKAKQGQSHLINTCIACNQACLDHVFQGKRATCLVNPRAAYELKFPVITASKPLHVGVIGAGPAGLSAALALAERGHAVQIFEAGPQPGGQFLLAQNIPGKSDFSETLRYFVNQLTKKYEIEIQCNQKIDEEMLDAFTFDALVLATGVRPREISFKVSAPEKLISYDELLSGKKHVGHTVAVIGAGGIGFDVCEFLIGKKSETVDEFWKTWQMDATLASPGGLLKSAKKGPVVENPRKVYLLKRSKGKFGQTLGKTTGWVHRLKLKSAGVEMMDGVHYLELSSEGLVIERNGETVVLPVDHVVSCAGQVPVRSLLKKAFDKWADKFFVIGGAKQAGELDAQRAIHEGLLVAVALSRD